MEDGENVNVSIESIRDVQSHWWWALSTAAQLTWAISASRRDCHYRLVPYKALGIATLFVSAGASELVHTLGDPLLLQKNLWVCIIAKTISKALDVVLRLQKGRIASALTLETKMGSPQRGSCLSIKARNVFHFEWHLYKAFAKRGVKDPDLKTAHNLHTLSSVLGGALFIADDVHPNTHFLHAGWHLATAISVGTLDKLLNSVYH